MAALLPAGVAFWRASSANAGMQRRPASPSVCQAPTASGPPAALTVCGRCAGYDGYSATHLPAFCRAAARPRRGGRRNLSAAIGVTVESDALPQNGHGGPRSSPLAPWTAADSAALYNVDGWGAPYFGVNAAGNVVVRPCGASPGPELELSSLVDAAAARGLPLPLVLRFPDILADRLHRLQACFSSAVARFGYGGSYQGVFPVKCHQDRHVIAGLLAAGRGVNFGLEAGSKPELLLAVAALTTAKCGPGSLLVCNGYKDAEYVELVLLSRKLAVNAVIVLEQPGELATVVAVAARLGVSPVLGVRVRLATRHDGHWGGTSGDDAKFGLGVGQILDVVASLRSAGLLHTLRLLHFHIGSQVPSIGTIKAAMREASHVYAELVTLGAPMGYLDVGGGLGLDYDGSRSGGRHSADYDAQNYANDVVAAVGDACSTKGVPPPIIVTESGRHLASHAAVLAFERTEAPTPPGRDPPGDEGWSAATAAAAARLDADHGGLYSSPHGPTAAAMGAPPTPGRVLLSNFRAVLSALAPTAQSAQEASHDAHQCRSEARSLFSLGLLSLAERAAAEALAGVIAARSSAAAALVSSAAVPPPPPCVVHVNMSVFRSVPDAWAIGQLFPVMPLQRLRERPTAAATLADLTCDSDGKLERFVGPGGAATSSLPMHGPGAGSPAERYLLGLFLGGVYQEVMGSAHNLFGATAAAHIRVAAAAPAGYVVESIVRGESMGDVLARMQHAPPAMLESIRMDAEAAAAAGAITVAEAQRLLRTFERCLGAYTYLRRESDSTGE